MNSDWPIDPGWISGKLLSLFFHDALNNVKCYFSQLRMCRDLLRTGLDSLCPLGIGIRTVLLDLQRVEVLQHLKVMTGLRNQIAFDQALNFYSES